MSLLISISGAWTINLLECDLRTIMAIEWQLNCHYWQLKPSNGHWWVNTIWSFMVWIAITCSFNGHWRSCNGHYSPLKANQSHSFVVSSGNKLNAKKSTRVLFWHAIIWWLSYIHSMQCFLLVCKKYQLDWRIPEMLKSVVAPIHPQPILLGEIPTTCPVLPSITKWLAAECL